MFKQNDIVIYPKYGVSKIEKIYDESGEKYYEISAQNGIKVSLPVARAEELGMRLPLTDKVLLALLKKVKSIEISEEQIINFDINIMKKLRSGKLEELLEFIYTIRAATKDNKLTGKTLSTKAVEYYRNAVMVANSEIEFVLGEKDLDKYRL